MHYTIHKRGCLFSRKNLNFEFWKSTTRTRMIQRMEMQEFDRLYGAYKPRFILIACSYLRDRSAAEDLVTDCFMHFWEKREEIVPTTENIPAYILGMVRHKCIDALRTRQQHLLTHQQIYQLEMRNIRENLAALEECDLAKILFRSEVEEIFRRRLAEMPELSAQIFIANRFENQTYQEIAQRYGISVRKVTREIQRCLKLLREDLGDYLPVALLLFPHFLDK